MTEKDFAYWLQGFFEISDAKSLGERETQIIKEHLQLVFTKVTPDHTSEGEMILDDKKKQKPHKVSGLDALGLIIPESQKSTVYCGHDDSMDITLCSAVDKPICSIAEKPAIGFKRKVITHGSSSSTSRRMC